MVVVQINNFINYEIIKKIEINNLFQNIRIYLIMNNTYAKLVDIINKRFKIDILSDSDYKINIFNKCYKYKINNVDTEIINLLSENIDICFVILYYKIEKNTYNADDVLSYINQFPQLIDQYHDNIIIYLASECYYDVIIKLIYEYNINLDILEIILKDYFSKMHLIAGNSKITINIINLINISNYDINERIHGTYIINHFIYCEDEYLYCEYDELRLLIDSGADLNLLDNLTKIKILLEADDNIVELAINNNMHVDKFEHNSRAQLLLDYGYSFDEILSMYKENIYY